MRALTIVQPYASLICLPDDVGDAKRVENRSWLTSYRGPLAIHAGKSRERLDEIDEYPCLESSDLTFGAVVAVARLAGCFRMDGADEDAPRSHWTVPKAWINRHPWLPAHMHTEGPCCWILAEVRPLAEPVYCSGAQGLWTPSPEVVEVMRERLERQYGRASA